MAGIGGLFLLWGLAYGQPFAVPTSNQPRPPLFLPEQLTKYTLGDNTLHEFIDRPLLADRSLRGVSNDYRGLTQIDAPGFQRKCDIARLAGADGFIAFLGTASHNQRYGRLLGASTFPIIPTFAPPSGGFSADPIEKRIEPMAQALDLSAKSPDPLRVNGKLLVTSYNASAAEPATWKAVLQTLRGKVGDTFYLVADLNAFGGKPLYAWSKAFYSNGQRLAPAEQEQIRQGFRQYLDVTDGLLDFREERREAQDARFAVARRAHEERPPIPPHRDAPRVGEAPVDIVEEHGVEQLQVARADDAERVGAHPAPLELGGGHPVAAAERHSVKRARLSQVPRHPRHHRLLPLPG